jgi:hypothetical protein
MRPAVLDACAERHQVPDDIAVDRIQVTRCDEGGEHRERHTRDDRDSE